MPLTRLPFTAQDHCSPQKTTQGQILTMAAGVIGIILERAAAPGLGEGPA